MCNKSYFPKFAFQKVCVSLDLGTMVHKFNKMAQEYNCEILTSKKVMALSGKQPVL
jgi:hypothetical protein